MNEGFLQSMKVSYGVDPIDTLKVYNSCLDYLNRRYKTYAHYKDAVNVADMTERFLIPLDRLKNYIKTK